MRIAEGSKNCCFITYLLASSVFRWVGIFMWPSSPLDAPTSMENANLDWDEANLMFSVASYRGLGLKIVLNKSYGCCNSTFLDKRHI